MDVEAPFQDTIVSPLGHSWIWITGVYLQTLRPSTLYTYEAPASKTTKKVQIFKVLAQEENKCTI